MNRIIIDDTLRQKLQGLTQELELQDEAGQVLGTFLPKIKYLQGFPGEPLLNEEELRCIEQSTEWYSTDQVLAHLRQLENK